MNPPAALQFVEAKDCFSIHRRYASSVRIDMCRIRINCRASSINGDFCGRDM
jgi:hypothetical protein